MRLLSNLHRSWWTLGLLLLGALLWGVTAAYAQSVTATITVGAGPARVAVNPITNRIYVANQFGNSVSVIDGTSNSVIATIPVGTGPVGIDVNPTTNRIYVANFGAGAGNSVSVIDG